MATITVSATVPGNKVAQVKANIFTAKPIPKDTYTDLPTHTEQEWLDELFLRWLRSLNRLGKQKNFVGSDDF